MGQTSLHKHQFSTVVHVVTCITKDAALWQLTLTGPHACHINRGVATLPCTIWRHPNCQKLRKLNASLGAVTIPQVITQGLADAWFVFAMFHPPAIWQHYCRNTLQNKFKYPKHPCGHDYFISYSIFLQLCTRFSVQNVKKIGRIKLMKLVNVVHRDSGVKECGNKITNP